jgi:hypothetical protein
MPAARETTRLHALGRAAAALGLVLLAVAALLSGTDRTSREFPSSPSLVGWPYDTGAARAHAILAFVQKGPASALSYARRSVLSDPISIQTVSILGRSELYSGRLKEAYSTFQVAGQLGWRDELTQIYWMDQALQAGDLKVAAQRLDALLRQSPNNENRDTFLAAVSASPEGRAAIAERLKLSPGWAPIFAASFKDLTNDQLLQRVDIMRRTGRGVWDCSATETIAQQLIDRSNVDLAQAIWRQNCLASGALVYDGSFDRLDTTKTASGFAWQLTNSGDVDIQPIQTTGGNQRLDILVSAPRTMPVLSQLIVLEPGRYRLTWDMPGTDQAGAAALRVTLACQSNLAEGLTGKPDPTRAERFSLDFAVDQSCAARKLMFWLAPKVQVHLDNIALQPIR